MLARLSGCYSLLPLAVNKERILRLCTSLLGAFNHADLKTVLPKFHQHVKCATGGENTLDKVFSNIKSSYMAKPLPHLGQSYHLSLLLIPACTPSEKVLSPQLRLVKSGLRTPHISSRIALREQIGASLNSRTWRTTSHPS